MAKYKSYRKPYRVKKKKSIFRNRFFWLSILVLMVLTGVFYLICFSSFFQIKKIQVIDSQKVSGEEIENIARQKIKQKIFIFSSESIFLADFKRINEATLEQFPQISQVSFTRKFPDTVIIRIEERKPKAVFNQDEKYFFIDEEGIIFEEIFEPSLNLLKIKKSTVVDELKLGKRIIEKEQISKILEIGSKLKDNLKVPIEEILIVSNERLNIKTLEGWEIYFNPKEDLDWQLTKLNSVLEKEIPAEKRGNLEYIELRFGNFAPYKYRSD